MPVVPTGVSERARTIYEYGLSHGTDPTHFSIIGDCQNVSSYFLSAFDKPGEYSLGDRIFLSPADDRLLPGIVLPQKPGGKRRIQRRGRDLAAARGPKILQPWRIPARL